MIRKSVVNISTLVCCVIIPGNYIFPQETTVQQIVESIQSRLIERDSTLSDYTIKMDITTLNY